MRTGDEGDEVVRQPAPHAVGEHLRWLVAERQKRVERAREKQAQHQDEENARARRP